MEIVACFARSINKFYLKLETATIHGPSIKFSSKHEFRQTRVSEAEPREIKGVKIVIEIRANAGERKEREQRSGVGG
jgi:hypothetical protein